MNVKIWWGKGEAGCCCCSHRAGARNVIKRHQTVTWYSRLVIILLFAYSFILVIDWLLGAALKHILYFFLFLGIMLLITLLCFFIWFSMFFWWRLMTFRASTLWLQQQPVLRTLLSQAIDNSNRNKAFFVTLIKNNKDNAYHRDWFLKLLINLIAYYLLSPHLHPIGCSLL